MYRKPSVTDAVILDPPEDRLLNEFAAWMKNERGLAAGTIIGECWHVRVFYRWCRHRNLFLS